MMTDEKKSRVMYRIKNFRPIGTEVSSSEYIKKTHNLLNMTKTHGLGSGIYGVIETPQMLHTITTSSRQHELQSVFELHNPVILDTDEKHGSFIYISRYLMDLCEAQINQQGSVYRDLSKSISEYNLIRKNICPLSNTIGKAVNQFIKDYRFANIGDFLRQPINYLLEGHYDGIYNISDNGNSFSTGSVAFIHQNPRHQKYAFDPEGALLQPDKTLIIKKNRHSWVDESNIKKKHKGSKKKYKKMKYKTSKKPKKMKYKTSKKPKKMKYKTSKKPKKKPKTSRKSKK